MNDTELDYMRRSNAGSVHAEQFEHTCMFMRIQCCMLKQRNAEASAGRTALQLRLTEQRHC